MTRLTSTLLAAMILAASPSLPAQDKSVFPDPVFEIVPDASGTGFLMIYEKAGMSLLEIGKLDPERDPE